MENSNMNNKSNNESLNPSIECYICMDRPHNPVATTCGHIFCWRCLQQWASGKSLLQCPVCKNGLDMNRVIPLYTGHSASQERDDRPRVERVDPVRQKNSFVGNIARGLGFYGSQEEVYQEILPSQNDVKVNQMATVICILGIFIIMSIFYFN